MVAAADVLNLLSNHGIAILFPLAVVEGPIATVIAAWLASIGLLDLRQVLVCVIAADLVGDSFLYLVGRLGLDRLPYRWRVRLGLTNRRLKALTQAFHTKATRILVIGKLTHAAGFAVLIAAGAVRMRFLPFLAANFAATVPKSLALAALGYLAGSAYGRIADWIYWGSALVLGILILALINRRKLIEWWT